MACPIRFEIDTLVGVKVRFFFILKKEWVLGSAKSRTHTQPAGGMQIPITRSLTGQSLDKSCAPLGIKFSSLQELAKYLRWHYFILHSEAGLGVE